MYVCGMSTKCRCPSRVCVRQRCVTALLQVCMKQQLNSYGCNVKSGRTSFIGQEQNKFKCTYAVCQSM